jgi:hypothetical protein
VELKKSIVIYSFVMGLMLIIVWFFLLITQNPVLILDIEAKPVEMLFVLFVEILTALTLLIASYGIYKSYSWSRDVFILGNGMLLYSMINNLGFSIQVQDITNILLMSLLIPINLIFIYATIVKFETPVKN